MGAPLGNQNGVRGVRWRDAVERALEHRSRGKQIQALDECAMQLIDQCLAGDLAALKELGDRLDGRPAQQMTLSSDAQNPFTITLVTFANREPDPPT